jgi:hypothetical protein
VKGNVIGDQSIHQKTAFTLIYIYFRRLRQFAYFSFLQVLIDSASCIALSAIFDDSRVPREYLLAMTSGCIAVVRTKVLVSSSLSINRSNRLARFGYRLRVLALCVCRFTFASTRTKAPYLAHQLSVFRTADE